MRSCSIAGAVVVALHPLAASQLLPHAVHQSTHAVVVTTAFAVTAAVHRLSTPAVVLGFAVTAAVVQLPTAAVHQLFITAVLPLRPAAHQLQPAVHPPLLAAVQFPLLHQSIQLQVLLFQLAQVPTKHQFQAPPSNLV